MRPFTAAVLVEDEELWGCDWLNIDVQLGVISMRFDIHLRASLGQVCDLWSRVNSNMMCGAREYTLLWNKNVLFAAFLVICVLKKKHYQRFIKQADLTLPTIPGVFLISCASRMKRGSDSTGPQPQFCSNKGGCAEYPVDCAFWREALHIKQACLSVSAQAAATKSEFPALRTLRILAPEFCKGRD